MGKVSEHTTKYKIQSRNLLTKFRKEKKNSHFQLGWRVGD